MKWAYTACSKEYSFNSKRKTYQQLFNHLENKMYLGLGRPQIIPVKFYGDNFQMEVVAFDVSKVLMSLFQDSSLNKLENLVVNNSNRFAKYVSPDGKLGEINSGLWYKNAYNHCISDPDTEFLCLIILASDKTTLSDMGDLHVDAIFLTTSIFDRKVR